jgi:hypothetical protein
MIRAAEVKGDEKKSPDQLQRAKPVIPWSSHIPYALMVAIVAIPLGFAIAYTGNSLRPCSKIT